MKTLLLFIAFLSTAFLIKAQNIPIAVNDTAVTMTQVPVEIPVLLNDYDPDGAEIEIRNYKQAIHGNI